DVHDVAHQLLRLRRGYDRAAPACGLKGLYRCEARVEQTPRHYGRDELVEQRRLLLASSNRHIAPVREEDGFGQHRPPRFHVPIALHECSSAGCPSTASLCRWRISASRRGLRG